MSLLQCYIRRPIRLRTQFFTQCCHRLKSNTSLYKCVLNHRALVEVCGKDSVPLLQGLITNNMNSLSESNPSLYAMLLNDKGRIVHDLMVYKGSDDGQFFLECDSAEDENLVDLLKRYKLRKKVAISRRTDVQVFSIFPSAAAANNNSLLSELQPRENEHYFKDPRVSRMGVRILTDSLLLPNTSDVNLCEASLDTYTLHRYNMGIGEGTREVGGGIPLEHNIEWLNGVAFDKGCYIGQELVARVHFTGQVRKRVMPLLFERQVESGADIRNFKGRKIGRVLGCLHADEAFHGIGVLNVEQGMSDECRSFDTTSLHIVVEGEQDSSNIKVVTLTPDWWPIHTGK